MLRKQLKMQLKNSLHIIWCYIECYWTKIQRLFGYRKDTSVIPEGLYCYVLDEIKNKISPDIEGGYWIKPCPYYRNLKYKSSDTYLGLYAGCTYTGFIGWDLCLGDQCKICGINDYDEKYLK